MTTTTGARKIALAPKDHHHRQEATMSVPDAPIVRIPTRFLDDHESRELPMPEIVKRTRRYAWVRAEGEGWDDLLSDARYYADPAGFDEDVARCICPAARALLRAVAAAHVDPEG